jgi:hypothetical protein
MIVDFLGLIDWRWSLVLSPITTAIAWAILVYGEPNLQDPWWF